MKLPNVRKLFIPDPGFVLVDADLAGADARVAAWECGGKFKEDFIAGAMKHAETMKLCYPEAYAKDPKHEPEYTKCKNILYGSLYVGSPRGLSQSAAVPEALVRKFQPWFFGRYPEIKTWHRDIEYELQTTREIRNAFGYRVHYFDRPDGLLPDAVNWKCQSTVAIVTQKGKIILWKEFAKHVQLLLDVHDSLIFQVREKELHSGLLQDIRSRLDGIVVPYPDPLRIPWSFKWSQDSWGACTPVQWEKLAA